MNRHEFKSWADDLAARLPNTGRWVQNLGRETRDVWFTDVFEQFDLADAIAVNRQLMFDGELEAYERERIPALFIKRLQEQAHKRRSEQENAKRRRSHQPLRKSFTGAMMAMCERVNKRIHDWKAQHPGEKTPHGFIETWTQEASDQYDKEPDDPINAPSFRCLACEDSGFVGYRDSDGVDRIGHCPKCEIHHARQPYRSGRKLGMAKIRTKNALSNPFDEALQSLD